YLVTDFEADEFCKALIEDQLIAVLHLTTRADFVVADFGVVLWVDAEDFELDLSLAFIDVEFCSALQQGRSADDAGNCGDFVEQVGIKPTAAGGVDFERGLAGDHREHLLVSIARRCRAKSYSH